MDCKEAYVSLFFDELLIWFYVIYLVIKEYREHREEEE